LVIRIAPRDSPLDSGRGAGVVLSRAVGRWAAAPGRASDSDRYDIYRAMNTENRDTYDLEASLRGGSLRQSTSGVASDSLPTSQPRCASQRLSVREPDAVKSETCAGVAVADLPGQRGRRLSRRGLGQLIPHLRNRMALEILRGILVGLKVREWQLCGGKVLLHCPPICDEIAAVRLPPCPGPFTLTNPPGNRRNLDFFRSERMALDVEDVVIVPLEPGNSDFVSDCI
jgi:hypothetical protein